MNFLSPLVHAYMSVYKYISQILYKILYIHVYHKMEF